VSTDRRTDSRWLALLALPVVCCLGHAVLLASGVGSLSAVVGARTGSVLLAVTAGSLRASTAIRTAPSRSSSGYFRGAAIR
jgi:hypothetical protein